jgi:hypothetical protein
LEFALEVVSEGGVLSVGLHFELFVWKVEEEDTEKIVDEADDGHVEGKLTHVWKWGYVSLVLDGLKKEEQESKGEEDADEDVDHEHLIA